LIRKAMENAFNVDPSARRQYELDDEDED